MGAHVRRDTDHAARPTVTVLPSVGPSDEQARLAELVRVGHRDGLVPRKLMLHERDRMSRPWERDWL
ncbi:MAG: hypothetical protein ACR2JV_06190 [Gaiellales bacterium]